MTTDIHRPHILGKPEPMPEELLRHVVASLANRDVLNLSAEMGRRLLADRDYHAQRAEHFPTVAGAMAELARGLQSVAVAAGWPVDMPVEEPCELAESVAELRRHAEIGRQWEEDSSLERWFPLTAERLNEAEAEIARLKPDQVTADLRRPAPFSVREAIREAGLDEGLSSAEAICTLAAEVAWRRADLARAAEDFAALEVQLAAARAEVASLRSQIDNTGHTANRSHALELAAALRRETLNGNPPMATTMLLAGELLAADAECRRLRSRVRVKAEDVEHRKITDGLARRYLLAHGFTLGHRFRGGGPDRDPLDLVHLCWDDEAIGALADNDDEACSGFTLAFIICWLARKDSRSSWDILDEMARMPTEPSPG